MRNVVMISTARTVWILIPCGANFYGVGIIKYFFTDCIATHSSYEAKLIALMKFIITHNVEAQSSYSTVVGSNLTRSQCLSRCISEVFLYR